jgi:transcriptional regulator with XRE-family HTH domain
MNDPRLGMAYRALRRRKKWRRRDVGEAVGMSQQFISKVERGRIGDVSIDDLRAVASALGSPLALELRWQGGDLDRLLDERHVVLVGSTVAQLRGWGWLTDVEVTYSHFGERGSIDILAWHGPTRTLLVIEIKSELVSVEATLRKLDEKVRLAPKVAAERWEGRAQAVARMLVLPSTTTERRRVARHAPVLDAALPLRFEGLRAWLRRPAGPASGILCVAPNTRSGAKYGGTTADRVRVRESARKRG